ALETEMIEFGATRVRFVESRAFRIEVEFEFEGRPGTRERGDLAARFRDAPPSDEMHAEESLVEIEAAIEIANANAGVRETHRTHPTTSPPADLRHGRSRWRRDPRVVRGTR